MADGTTYIEFGKAVSGDDLHRESVDTYIIQFKDVVSIEVESLQERRNRRWAELAHPEISIQTTPAVYDLVLKGAKKDAFSVHSTFDKGKEPAQDRDSTGDTAYFVFRDEETANRLAKAMVHAVELCGGGTKPEPF